MFKKVEALFDNGEESDLLDVAGAYNYMATCDDTEFVGYETLLASKDGAATVAGILQRKRAVLRPYGVPGATLPDGTVIPPLAMEMETGEGFEE